MVRYVRNSETSLWRECRLKWYLSYYRGFLTDRVNPKFWLGTLVHYALSEWYRGHVSDPAHLFWWLAEESIQQERGLSIEIDGEDLGFDQLVELEEAQALGLAMVEGYVEWAAEFHNDFEVLDSEIAYYIELTDYNDRPFTFVARLDLLAEDSEGIRVHDFKTAKDFRAKDTVHADPQFRRYAWVLTEAHPHWAGDVVGSMWVGLRKIVPSARSKPPYYDRVPVDLTFDEIDGTKREVLAEVTDMLEVEEWLKGDETDRKFIFPNPTMDCAWRCQYFRNGMCNAWRAGQDVTELGSMSGTWGNDPYKEYREDDETAVPIGRREGGE